MTLLADRVRSDSFWRKRQPANADEETIRRWLTREMLPVYEVSNVADFLGQGTTDFAHLTDFPNVAPLHIVYWMEWRSPTRLVPLVGADKREPTHVGVLLWQEAPPDEDGNWPIGVHAWGMWKDRKRPEPLVSWQLVMKPYDFPEVVVEHPHRDLDGLFSVRRRVEPDEVELPPIESREHAQRLIEQYRQEEREATERIDALTSDLDQLWARWVRYAVLHPALMAHSLLACKNVETDTHTPPPALSKRHQRKHGEPLLRFKTLRIVPMGRAKGESANGEGFDQPLHIVRGHFKTFTSERPLFGRLVGTYWWASALRGKAEHGVVVKDYQVSALALIGAKEDE